MNYSEFDYRFAKTILQAHHPAPFHDIQAILETTPMKLGRGHRPTPSQILQRELESRGWAIEETVASTEFRFDAFKDRVAVEIETTDPADVINEYLKFQKADSRGQLDVGVLIVYDDSIKGDNLPTLNAARKGLLSFSNFISTPLWIIGLRDR